MNNPLRYAGTTFYQADFGQADRADAPCCRSSKNPGWMTPYVACMLVVTGMLAHFGVVAGALPRAATKRTAGERASARGRRRRARSAIASPTGLPGAGRRPVRRLRRRQSCACRISPPSEMQIYEFGKLPLAYQGRVKPYDTVARNTLQILSGRQEVVVTDKDGKNDQAAGDPLAARRDLRRRRPPTITASSASRISNCSTRSASSRAKARGATRSNEIRDELRRARRSKSSWPPRSRKASARAIQQAVLELASKLSRYATLVQVVPLAGNFDRARRVRSTALQQVQADIAESARRRGPARRAAGATPTAAGRR